MFLFLFLFLCRSCPYTYAYTRTRVCACPRTCTVAAFDDGLILLGMEQNRAATRAAGVIAEERKPPKGTEQETGRVWNRWGWNRPPRRNGTAAGGLGAASQGGLEDGRSEAVWSDRAGMICGGGVFSARKPIGLGVC